MLVRPGSEVALATDGPAGVDRDEILASLRTAVERTGWKVVPKADTTVAAIIGRGETKQLEYHHQGPGVDRKNAPKETVSITPFTARLEIRRAGQVLWSRESINHVPRLIFLRGKETLQEAVSKFERPDADFFARLHLPPRVPKPDVARGLGRSTLDGMAWKDAPLPKAGTPPARRR